MTPVEFGALCARRKQEQEQAYWRTGVIASTIANANRDPKKRPKPFTPQEFMPGQKPKRQTWQSQLEFIKMLNTAFGGEDMRKGAQ